MASLEEFSKRIGAIGIAVEANSETTTRKAALAADTAVVTGTPVYSGRARSNWQVEIDAPAEGTREPYAPGEALGRGESANLNAALTQGASKIAQYKGDKNREIHITNNLPYIQELNDGSSQQAPANFVETAVAAAVNAVQGAKLVPNNIGGGS